MTRTYDGIDWCSERVVEEITREFRRLAKTSRKVVSFSIIGYSLGGLIARYTVGLLYARGFFHDVEAINFTTMATPHIGIPKTDGWFSKVATIVGSRVLGRTGTQFYGRDHGWQEDHQEPSSSKKAKITLLEAMARPESNFYKALANFRNVDFYANALSDLTVPLRTGGVMDRDPWKLWPENGEDDLAGNGIKVELNPDYPALLKAIHIPKEPPPRKPLGVRIYRAIVPQSWPWILNPYRIPWRFPLNWIAVIFFPIALPLAIVLLVTRLASGGRESNKRVKDLEKQWLQGKGLQDTRYNKQHEQSRISAAMMETVQAVGENHVESVHSQSDLHEAQLVNTSAASNKHSISRRHHHRRSSSSTLLPLHFDITPAVAARIDSIQPRLSDVQQKMQTNLNNLPQLRKHLTYFDNVMNSHAIIICRTHSIEVHRRGKEAVRHWVDHFEV